MMGFILGSVFGGSFGFLLCSVMTVGKRADQHSIDPMMHDQAGLQN